MSDVEVTDSRAVVALIAAAFPWPTWSIETLRLYARELADVPLTPLKLAAREWIQTRTERPTIAELRTAARGMAQRLRNERRKALRQHREPLEALEPADPAEVRKLLADVRQRLEGKARLIALRRTP